MRARSRAALGAGLVLACALLATPRAPAVVAARLGSRAPEVYRWLAQRPPSEPVLEVPGRVAPGDLLGQVAEARYMLGSTIHWHPLLGGYTAYAPPTVAFFTAITQRLPDVEALALLVDTVDVRWIVVHGANVWAPTRARWAALTSEGLELAGRFYTDEVYEVKRLPRHPWREQILPRSQAPAVDTLEGTALAPLAPDCRQARILDVLAPRSIVPSPVPVPIPVRFQNTSRCTWPALGVRPEGLVGLGYRWTSPGGRIYPSDAFSRLLHDVRPGETVESPALVFPGGELGTWRLEVLLEQHGQPEPLATKTADIEVVRWNLPPPLPPPN
jgi:hypothetical protein